MKFSLNSLSLHGIIVISLLLAGCVTNSESESTNKNDDDNQLPAKKTITITHGATRLIEHEQVHFRVTSTPTPKSNEWLVYKFTSPDSTKYIIQDAHTENELMEESFGAGNWTLFVAIYDSTEFKALGELAQDHGSTSLSIAVRKITTSLTASVGATPQDLIFHASSPEEDWIHTDADYVWSFGDGETVTTTGVNSVEHRYESSGELTATVSIRCAIYDNDSVKYEVAADSMDIIMTNASPFYRIQSVNFDFTGLSTKYTGALEGNVFTESASVEDIFHLSWSTPKLTWDGLDFSYSRSLSNGVQFINGSVSDDCSTIIKLTYTLIDNDNNYLGQGDWWWRLEKVVIENVPLTAIGSDHFRFNGEGATVSQYFTEFEISETLEHFGSGGIYDHTYWDVDWENTSMDTLNLTVEFK